MTFLDGEEDAPKRVQPPQVTQEFLRIVGLPRRRWTEMQTGVIARKVSSMLAIPGAAPPPLWGIQAVALLEMSQCNGAFIPVRAGGGKTLISLLAPTAMKAARPLLLVPAKLREKTKRAYRDQSTRWQIHPMIRIESYQWLGRVQAKEALDLWQPDIVICDEGHYLKNQRAGVTIRLMAWLRANPHVRLVIMSGTITKRSIKDYCHLVSRCLGPINSPVPNTYNDLETWSNVLDEKLSRKNEYADPGALATLAQSYSLDAVRKAFRHRMVDTLGVIATEETSLDCPLLIETRDITPPPIISKALADMRTQMATPSGREFFDAVELWRHCRELALGFFYEWEPDAPKPWREARKDWARWCRYLIRESRGAHKVVTPLDASLAVARGHYPDAAPSHARWRAIEPTFRPKNRAVWVSDYMLELVASIARTEGPMLVWAQHVAWAEELERRSGMIYYGPGAMSNRGKSILDHDPRQGSCIVSAKSVSEGFDLQRWSRNVIASCFTNALEWEQTLARTHRPGQEADEVSCTVLLSCDEHEKALAQSMRDAVYTQDSTGQKQKLLLADWT